MKYFSLDLSTIAVLLLSMCCWSCSDDEEQPVTYPDAEFEALWGPTMAGNDPEEITWPDLCENYWEYTMDVSEHSNLGLRFEGEFPKEDVRFFNITLYDDVTTKRIASIEDFNVATTDGSDNPFAKDGVTGTQTFQVNAVPSGTSETVKKQLQNVLEFPNTTNRLCILLRIYFNKTDHPADFGGVKKPAMKFFDLSTGKDVSIAARAESHYYEKFSAIINSVPLLKSIPVMVFTLAPNVLYSNGPTGYVSSANRMTTDSVLLFRFIPPVSPTHVAENRNADVRYWSICVGDTATYTRSTIPDRATKKSDDGYVNFMIIDKSTTNYDKIVAKAASMNINVVNWEKEKWGEGLMVFYRQMYIKKGFQYSVQNIPAYPPLVNGRPDQSVPIKPENMAHITLGEHGPSGMKLPAAIVLSDAFNYNFMRMPNF